MKPAAKKSWVSHVVFLTAFALAVAWLSGFALRYVLPSEPAPIVFDDSVLREKDPFLADIRALTQTIEQRWSYLEYRRQSSQVDLEALEAQALAALGVDPGEDAFRLAVTRYLAGLRDGHAAVFFAEWRSPGDRRWPVTLVEVAEGIMIDGVAPDVGDELERGDLVLTVDDRPVEQWITDTERSVCASTDGARRCWAIREMARWTSRTELRLGLRRGDGTAATVVVSCPHAGVEIASPAALLATRVVRMLDDGIAYFRPGSFSAPVGSDFRLAPVERRDEILASSYEEMSRTFDGFAEARALILDLRGNPGGTDLLGQSLVSHLLEPGFVYYMLSSLRGTKWSGPTGGGSGAPPPSRVLQCPVVCLIDAFVFSTADNVAACLRDLHPSITFVGRPNGAGTGAPRFFELPRTKTRVAFCTMRVYSPEGQRIEGAAIVPDFSVRWTRADVLEGRDPDLNAALEVLGR